MRIDSFPPFFPRNIDLLTPLSLQEKLDPHLELFYCMGHVSVPLREATGGREVETNLGVRIKASSIHRGMTEVGYGTPTPTGTRLSQREILEDVVANTSTRDVPEVVLKRRGVREDVPARLEDVDVFEESDSIFYLQNAVGNRYRSLRRMLQLPLSNPYRIAKGALLLHRVVSPYDPVFKRMRSVLKTNWVTTNRMGWKELQAHNLPLQRTLCREKWWHSNTTSHK